MRSWGLHREAGAEPGRHPPRGAKTRRSPQSMKPTISFGARRARARTAGREKSPITSPSLVSFTSSFTSSSCDRSSGSGEAAESTPRASSFGIVGRSGVSKGSRQARGSRRSHSRKKTSSPFRSIPKSSRRYETNPSPFFFRRVGTRTFELVEARPAAPRAHDPERVVPREKRRLARERVARGARRSERAEQERRTRVSRGGCSVTDVGDVGEVGELRRRRRRRVASVPAALRRDFIFERRVDGHAVRARVHDIRRRGAEGREDCRGPDQRRVAAILLSIERGGRPALGRGGEGCCLVWLCTLFLGGAGDGPHGHLDGHEPLKARRRERIGSKRKGSQEPAGKSTVAFRIKF